MLLSPLNIHVFMINEADIVVMYEYFDCIQCFILDYLETIYIEKRVLNSI